MGVPTTNKISERRIVAWQSPRFPLRELSGPFYTGAHARS